MAAGCEELLRPKLEWGCGPRMKGCTVVASPQGRRLLLPQLPVSAAGLMCGAAAGAGRAALCLLPAGPGPSSPGWLGLPWGMVRLCGSGCCSLL